MHTFQITVRGYELDSYGHVNNAVYVNYFEQARWEVLRDKKILEKYQNSGYFIVVAENTIRYHREATLFDTLTIETTMHKQSPYLVFKHKMKNSKDGLKTATATVKTLLLDKERMICDFPSEFFD
ncbi:MAG: acyl-CoA thioesterase [Lentimicrobiaceae bacterium]|nr:acyl-CoA thioesterase [Lentimicrobiaceae bacterium]